MLVACGYGVTILPDTYSHVSHGEVEFVPVEEMPEMEEHFVWRLDNINPCVKFLVQFMQERKSEQKNRRQTVGRIDPGTGFRIINPEYMERKHLR